MSEAETNYQARLKIANDYQLTLEERLQLAKTTFRELKELMSRYASLDGKSLKKLEKQSDRGTELSMGGFQHDDPIVIEDVLEAFEGRIDQLKEDLENASEVFDDTEAMYKDEREAEEDEEEGEEEEEEDEEA